VNDPGAASPLFRLPVSPRWRDLDAFNHVNNSNFLTYLEEARIRWFASLGKPWVTDTVAPLLAAVHINYRLPIAYPAQVVVELHADKLGTTSVTLGHRIVAADGGALHADGHVVMVWIDRASGKPVPLPAAIREVAEGLTSPPAGP
jgi:acyl-CoA thioester hydrolase